MPAFKPADYNSLSPYHVVDGADRYVAFLAALFGAQPLRRYTEGDRVVHAEVRIDDTVVMLSDATEQYRANQPLTHLYVADVDAVYRRALEIGCTAVGEPRQHPGDPDRRASFTDPFGNHWSVATQVPAATPSAP